MLIGRQLHHQRVADADCADRPRNSARVWALPLVVTSTSLAVERCCRPDLRREGAVDVHVERRRVGHLEDMGIDDSRHALQIVRQLGGQRIGLVAVRSRYADVDRRRLAEIQHLIDDIGGLEEELQLGKALRQLAPQPRSQVRCRRVLLASAKSGSRRPWVRRWPNRSARCSCRCRASRYCREWYRSGHCRRSSGWSPRPRRNRPESARSACPPARARAAASGRHRPAGRNPGRARETAAASRRSAARRTAPCAAARDRVQASASR